MIEFYINPLEIYPPVWQERRLGIIRAIVDAGIPCVIWLGRGRTHIAHCVPRLLFDFEILIPDKLVAKAASVVTSWRAEFELDLLETHHLVGLSILWH